MERPTREEILLAAGRLFAKKGFAGTSTAEIADEAGLQQPSIFYYFPSKEDILRALADRAIVPPLSALEVIAREPHPVPVKLGRLITFHLVNDLSDPFDMSVVADEAWRLPRDAYESWFTATERYTAGMRGMVQEGMDNGDFTDGNAFTVTMGILGMCNWTLKWYRKGGPISPRELSRDYVALTLRGLLREQRRLRGVLRAIDEAGLPGIASDPEQAAADEPAPAVAGS